MSEQPKLIFENLQPSLKFEDLSSKLIFDIIQVVSPTPSGGIGSMIIESTFIIG